MDDDVVDEDDSRLFGISRDTLNKWMSRSGCCFSPNGGLPTQASSASHPTNFFYPPQFLAVWMIPDDACRRRLELSLTSLSLLRLLIP